MASVLFAHVVGCGEWMSRIESLLLKVQGGELDVYRLCWSEVANVDGGPGVEGSCSLDGSGCKTAAAV